MAHYAKVVDGIVVNIIRADADFFETFIDDSPGEWIKTSYNTSGGIHYNTETYEPSDDQSKALRYNFACMGGMYDRDLDAFLPLKKYDSWVLDTNTCLWVAPTPKPDDGKDYLWDEDSVSWVENV